MKVNVSAEQNVTVQDAVSTDTVELEHDPDASTPLPRPERCRRRSKADRGLPDDAELARLAETYLEHQNRLFRNTASCGALPLANSETIQAMVDDFKRRHRGGGVDREQVKARLLLLHLTKPAGAYLRDSCDNSNPTSIVDQLVKCLEKSASEGNFIPWEYIFADYSVTSPFRRLMYELYVEQNWSIPKIAKHFSQLKVDGWDGWTTTAVKKLLWSPTALGIFTWNKTRREFDYEEMKWVTKMNPVSEWIVHLRIEHHLRRRPVQFHAFEPRRLEQHLPRRSAEEKHVLLIEHHCRRRLQRIVDAHPRLHGELHAQLRVHRENLARVPHLHRAILARVSVPRLGMHEVDDLAFADDVDFSGVEH